MTNDLQRLTNVKKAKRCVRLANGTTFLMSKCVGDMVITLACGKILVLEDTLCVDGDWPADIVSVHRLVIAGYQVKFNQDGAFIFGKNCGPNGTKTGMLKHAKWKKSPIYGYVSKIGCGNQHDWFV